MDLKTIDPEPLISDPWPLKPLILWLLNCNLCFAIQFLDSYFGNKQVLAVSLIAYRTALGHQSNFAAPRLKTDDDFFSLKPHEKFDKNADEIIQI